MISPVSMASVSKVHFGDAAQDRLAREGAYAKAPTDLAAPEAAEKKPRKGKKLAVTLVVLAAVAATLAILSRKNVLKAIPADQLKDAKFFQKIGHYLNVAGEKVAGVWDKFIGLFSKNAKGAPEGV